MNTNNRIEAVKVDAIEPGTACWYLSKVDGELLRGRFNIPRRFKTEAAALKAGAVHCREGSN